MSQFDKWPVEDLRLYQETFESGKVVWLVYSFQMDALTPINDDVLAKLRQVGVQEITEMPE